MKNGDKKLLFETNIVDYELMNSEFTRATINIFHKGENRNGSFITEEAMQKMGKTLLGVPVIGEFLQDKQQIGGHGGKLVITDDGFEMIETTECMGFVDPRTEPFLKEYTETDGVTVNTYMCANVILWTGRFNFLQNELEKGLKQSMEIGIRQGEYDTETGYYIIKDAYFQALCLLGEGVEPCFSASKVQLNYSLDDNSTYAEMINKFKQYTIDELGGESMSEEQKEIQETEVEEVEPQVEDEVEDVEEEDIQDSETEKVEEVEESEGDTDKTTDVEQTGEEIEKVEKTSEEAETDYQVRIEELEMALAEAIREVEALKAENANLLDFKANIELEERQAKEQELFSKFSNLEGFEGYSDLVENAKQFSLEELETKLFALLGKKNFSMAQEQSKKQEPAKLSVKTHSAEPVEYCYGGRFDKYFK